MDTEWATTTTILQNLREYSNDDAWRRLVERFRPPIARFAERSGALPADADDVAQETLTAFAEAFRSGRYDPARGRLSQWLFGIAYKQVLRQRQSSARENAKRAVGGSSALMSHIPDEKSAEDVWNIEWERAVMQACMTRAQNEFEPETIRAFEAAVRDGRSAAEVADELGVPVKRIYNAKHRVLTRLRELRSELEDAV